MRLSIITPNWNGDRYLEQTLRSVVSQRAQGAEVEFIVVDGQSTDGSAGILARYRKDIDVLICEPDHGPASAINKGLQRATGDVIGWLNADDTYRPGALERVTRMMESQPRRALCFGHCLIVNEAGSEIRNGITRFKELFFPLSCRFMIQCINYVSQPAMFFRRGAMEKAGPLREDLKCAWDYEFLLRLWRQGGAARIPGPPLAAFRWHEASISGRLFRRQFKEEWDAAVADAGRFSPQALLHLGVRWGIVGSYSAMAWARQRRAAGCADRG
jgi:glycosyltransferase involved in cell wall biosynthesis